MTCAIIGPTNSSCRKTGHLNRLLLSNTHQALGGNEPLAVVVRLSSFRTTWSACTQGYGKQLDLLGIGGVKKVSIELSIDDCHSCSCVHPGRRVLTHIAMY